MSGLRRPDGIARATWWAGACTALLVGGLPAQWEILPLPLFGSPTARAWGAMAGHAAGGETLLFGGATAFATSTTNNGETWSCTAAGWSQRSPVHSPGARHGMSMVFDVLRGRFVLYGGRTASTGVGFNENDTWEFDGVDWSSVATAHDPGPLAYYGMSYDLLRGVVVVYGGNERSIGSNSQPETWEFDGLDWLQVTPAHDPGPLFGAAMTFHYGIGCTVLFGGTPSGGSLGTTDDTWLYDGLDWTQAAVVGQRPPARIGGRMVFDTVRGVAILWGGQDPGSSQIYSDTWEFDGASWTQVLVNSLPGRDACLAFDPGRRITVRFGGAYTVSQPSGVHAEYGARLQRVGFGCAGSAGVPDLDAFDAPRIGEPFQCTLQNLAPGAALAGIGLASSLLGGTLLDPIGMTGCRAWVDLRHIVVVPATQGSALWQWPMPPIATLLGVPLCFQGLSFDPGANPLGLTVSNALQAVLGW